MTIGMHTLQLARAIVVERRLEADLRRRWRIAPAAGISARGTPERGAGGSAGARDGRQPRPGVAADHRC